MGTIGKLCTLAESVKLATLVTILFSSFLQNYVAQAQKEQEKEIIRVISNESIPEGLEELDDNIAQILMDLFTKENDDDSQHRAIDSNRTTNLKVPSTNSTRKTRNFHHYHHHLYPFRIFQYRQQVNKRTDKHKFHHGKKKNVSNLRKIWGNPKHKRKGTLNHNYKLQKQRKPRNIQFY